MWANVPIGVPTPIFTHLFDSETDALPPVNDPAFRYVLLTAGRCVDGDYNEGAIANESVSGTNPLVIATAEICLPASPFHGKTVHLINTESRALVAGVESGIVRMDQSQGWQLGAAEDNIGPRDTWGYAGDRGQRVFGVNTGPEYNIFRFHTAGQGMGTMLRAMNDGVNGTPRQGRDTHGKDISAVYVLRVL